MFVWQALILKLSTPRNKHRSVHRLGHLGSVREWCKRPRTDVALEFTNHEINLGSKSVYKAVRHTVNEASCADALLMSFNDSPPETSISL